MSDLCGVILHPASHTRSPAMHTAAFEALGIDARYVVFDVPAEGLEEAIRAARRDGIRQLAVSVPHKETVMAHLDRVDETARTIGAVNTITRVGDELVGTNTDWIGITRAIERESNIQGKRAVVLGAGGTAHAAAYALCKAGCQITILNRTVARAEALARRFDIDSAGPLEALAEIDHDIMLQTTTVGLRSNESPVEASALRPGTVVFDAVYDPAETRLLKDAAKAGAHPIGGKWMLVYQAIEQIHAWTAQRPDPDLLATAFDAVNA
jgi:shikimate dehydrogenase